MTNVEKAYFFLERTGYYFLLTNDAGQPRGRAFSSRMLHDNRLYITTGNAKHVYQQIENDPKIEVLAYQMRDGEYMRLDATAVIDNDPVIIKKYLEKEPQVRGDFEGEAEPQIGMFYLKDASAEILSLDGSVKERFAF